jgi:hypothetical protein
VAAIKPFSRMLKYRRFRKMAAGDESASGHPGGAGAHRVNPVESKRFGHIRCTRFPLAQRILPGRHLGEFGIFERGAVKTQRDQSQPLRENLVRAEDGETGAFLSTNETNVR